MFAVSCTVCSSLMLNPSMCPPHMGLHCIWIPAPSITSLLLWLNGLPIYKRSFPVFCPHFLWIFTHLDNNRYSLCGNIAIIHDKSTFCIFLFQETPPQFGHNHFGQVKSIDYLANNTNILEQYYWELIIL